MECTLVPNGPSAKILLKKCLLDRQLPRTCAYTQALGRHMCTCTSPQVSVLLFLKKVTPLTLSEQKDAQQGIVKLSEETDWKIVPDMVVVLTHNTQKLLENPSQLKCF